MGFWWSEVRYHFVKWTEFTSWHGIHDLVVSKSFVSTILWICVLTGSTFMFTISIHAHVSEFVNGDTWEQVTYYRREVGGMLVPNVTICSSNEASAKRLQALGMSETVAAYIVDSLKEEPESLESMNSSYERTFRVAFEKYEANYPNRTLKDWVRDISPSCENFILRCSFGSLSFNCCQNARELFVFEKGKCYVIRPPEDIIRLNPQTVVGVKNGLHLLLYPELDDYAPIFEMPNAMDAGFQAFIGYSPEYMTKYTTPVAISPGTHTWIGMRSELNTIKIRKRLIPIVYPLYMPKLPCHEADHNTAAVGLNYIQGEYTLETCYADCHVAEVLKTCGCAPLQFVREHIPICDVVSWHKCRAAHGAAIDSKKSSSDYVSCLGNCTQPCHKRKVKLSSSATQYPAPTKVDILEDLVEEEASIPNSAISWVNVEQLSPVDIFFDSTKLSVVEKRERVTIEALISSIGGTLGVWAGISIITIYQAFVFLCYAVSAMCGLHKTRKLSRMSSRIGPSAAAANEIWNSDSSSNGVGSYMYQIV